MSATLNSADQDAHAATPVRTARKRLPRGERRMQILQTLAGMLEQPQGERVTTAALAARLEVSEAALYRHFASKAQMFEALIEFIENSVLGLIRQVGEVTAPPPVQLARMAHVILQFAEKNPGMARVMAGDALVLEHERLEQRVCALFDKLESQFKQTLRSAPDTHNTAGVMQAQLRAQVVCTYIVGRIHRFVRSGFRLAPSTDSQGVLALLLQ